MNKVKSYMLALVACSAIACNNSNSTALCYQSKGPDCWWNDDYIAAFKVDKVLTTEHCEQVVRALCMQDVHAKTPYHGTYICVNVRQSSVIDTYICRDDEYIASGTLGTRYIKYDQ